MALAHCHCNQSAAAVLLPLALARAIRVFNLRSESWRIVPLRASMASILMAAAGWLAHVAYTAAHPLTTRCIERCGPAPFLMK